MTWPTAALTSALGDAAGSLRLDRRDGVVTLTLDRPDKHNAVSYAMWRALAAVLPLLAGDETVDVLVLRGTDGGPFSAGADISEFSTLRADPEGAAAYGEAVEAGEKALMDFPRPTVALVEGFAIGGGTQLAVACDLRVCEAGSRFGVTPAKLGIVYAQQSTARLVEVVGAPWARWILLTGDLLDAATALRVGLVHEVLPDGAAVRARVDELTATLSSRARVSLTGGKALVDRAVAGRTEVDEVVRAHYAESLHGPEYVEGVAAFLAKRAPDFRAARRP